MNSLGERLRSVRGETSGSKFAQLFEERATNIYRYEKNVRKPKAAFLEQVSKMFGVSVEWLLFGDDYKNDGCSEAVHKICEPEIKKEAAKMPRYTDMEEILKRLEAKLEALFYVHECYACMYVSAFLFRPQHTAERGRRPPVRRNMCGT